MLTRRTLLTTAAAAASTAVFTRPVLSQEAMMFADNGVAIRGADTVAYFSQGATVKGSSEHAVIWAGATWQFSSADNLEVFMGNPYAFAPQFGGYCAFNLSLGELKSSDPEAWSVYDGKLYLNHSLGVRELWSSDIPRHVALADANWPGILG